MKTLSVIYFLLVLIIHPLSAQVYKVRYNELTVPLLTGNIPNICILEDQNAGRKLFDDLLKYEEFKSKYTSYPTNVLIENKDILQVDKFDPENPKFIQSLKEQLAIEYLLDWKALSDSAFQLNIFSTGSGNKIYSKSMYYSSNSDPFTDVKKLLVDDLDPIYISGNGNITIKANPASAKFKLMDGNNLIGEWSGVEDKSFDAGEYKLITEAGQYITNEQQVEIESGKTTSLEINLQPDPASLIKVDSPDKMISNIKSEIIDPQLKITFDLDSPEQDEFDIALKLINKSTKVEKDLKLVSGDILKIKPGKNKTLYWQMKNELVNDPIQNYEIQLLPEQRGGSTWYYYAGGGALLVGGAAVLLLGKKDVGTTPERTKIGSPPGRP